MLANKEWNRKNALEYEPGGAEPQASHRSGELTPAVNTSLGETIFTLSGFTVEWKDTLNNVLIFHIENRLKSAGSKFSVVRTKYQHQLNNHTNNYNNSAACSSNHLQWSWIVTSFSTGLIKGVPWARHVNFVAK